MKNLTLLLCFLAAPFLAQSQTPDLSDWLGHYEGTLYMEYPNRKTNSVEIHFDFQKIDSTHWSNKFTYMSEEYGDIVKDYILAWSDTLSGPNHFILDENNGILIDEILLNNTFYSQYYVAESHFQTVLRKEDDGLYFEIIVSSPEKGITSETSAEKGVEDLGKVESSLVYTIQYVHLKLK